MVTEHRGCKWQQSHQRPYLRFLNRNEVVQVTREEKGHQKTHRLLGDDDDEVCPAAKDTHREAVTPLQKSACSRGVWPSFWSLILFPPGSPSLSAWDLGSLRPLLKRPRGGTISEELQLHRVSENLQIKVAGKDRGWSRPLVEVAGGWVPSLQASDPVGPSLAAAAAPSPGLPSRSRRAAQPRAPRAPAGGQRRPPGRARPARPRGPRGPGGGGGGPKNQHGRTVRGRRLRAQKPGAALPALRAPCLAPPGPLSLCPGAQLPAPSGRRPGSGAGSRPGSRPADAARPPTSFPLAVPSREVTSVPVTLPWSLRAGHGPQGRPRSPHVLPSQPRETHASTSHKREARAGRVQSPTTAAWSRRRGEVSLPARPLFRPERTRPSWKRVSPGPELARRLWRSNLPAFLNSLWPPGHLSLLPCSKTAYMNTNRTSPRLIQTRQKPWK
ncbi:vegetative cell wall protein gp1-like [Camelus ferus]|uniref:Vegetative cell wall protein gp1-like n=1 Tax=Camelus ferus TaxID=419612 RepID=A0A8B8U8Q2_CAMFR|nr:vegetative cell wall protein gp1-like [Camelus ferus]